MITEITPQADQIGTLRATISELQAELKELEDGLKADGGDVYEGELFRVTVSWSDRKTTAWKAIAEKLGASKQMIAGNTKATPVTTLRCTSKLKS